MAKICTRFKSCLPFCAHCRCHNLLKAEKRKETRVDHATAAGCCCCRVVVRKSLLRDETSYSRAVAAARAKGSLSFRSEAAINKYTTHTLPSKAVYTIYNRRHKYSRPHQRRRRLLLLLLPADRMFPLKGKKKKHTQHAIVWARS